MEEIDSKELVVESLKQTIIELKAKNARLKAKNKKLKKKLKKTKSANVDACGWKAGANLREVFKCHDGKWDSEKSQEELNGAIENVKILKKHLECVIKEANSEFYVAIGAYNNTTSQLRETIAKFNDTVSSSIENIISEKLAEYDKKLQNSKENIDKILDLNMSEHCKEPTFSAEELKAIHIDVSHVLRCCRVEGEELKYRKSIIAKIDQNNLPTK